MFNPPLQVLVSQEPWRQRVGYPSQVDDPMWSPEQSEDCVGEIEWEVGSNKWHCRHCGYIGWATQTKHSPILSPNTFFLKTRDAYVAQRMKEKELGEHQIDEQMYFVMAAALRAAMKKKPHELRELVEKLSAL